MTSYNRYPIWLTRMLLIINQRFCCRVNHRQFPTRAQSHMVVKIAIWIIGLHNFIITPHQNVQNHTRILKIVGSYVRSYVGSYVGSYVRSYGILPILPKKKIFFFLWDKFFCFDENLRVFISSCYDDMTFLFYFYKIILT